MTRQKKNTFARLERRSTGTFPTLKKPEAASLLEFEIPELRVENAVEAFVSRSFSHVGNRITFLRIWPGDAALADPALIHHQEWA